MTMPRVFVSHSSQDAAWCRPFVAALRAAAYDCFFDEDSIPGTAPWVATIQREVSACDLFLLVLTPAAWDSPWVQDELQLALAERKRILTVLHQPTPKAGGFIRIYQWIAVEGLVPPQAAQRVLPVLTSLSPSSTTLPGGSAGAASPLSIKDGEGPGVGPPLPGVEAPILPGLDALGFVARLITPPGGSPVPAIIAPRRFVSAGRFLMGSATSDTDAFDVEKPQYWVPVDAFYIATYPLTVAEYTCAVNAGAVKAPQDFEYSGRKVTWKDQLQRPEHPVVCITWLDATAYAAWLAKLTSMLWRLPTEAEWEKAARWDEAKQHARIYPWGDEWDAARANTSDGGPGTTTPVGAYAAQNDASPYGCHDMAGNVWEWTSSIKQDYPYDTNKCENDSDRTSVRVLRGGSWVNDRRDARAAYRDCRPDNWDDSLGVRLLAGAGRAGTG